MSILKEYFLKSFQPFNKVAEDVKPTTTKLSFHTDPITTLAAMITNAMPLKKALHFKTIKHLSLAPPLFVIEKIQSVQSIQGLRVENRGGMMFIHQTDGGRHVCFSACSICFAFVLARRSYSHSSYLKAVSL